jgi:hypothetical protein
MQVRLVDARPPVPNRVELAFNTLQYCVEFLKNIYCISYYTAIIAPYSLLVNYFVQKSNMVPPPGYDPGSSDFQSVAMTTSAKAG